MIIGEYSVFALAKQYGISDIELEKMLNVGFEPGISKDLARKLKKVNEINIMRYLDNSSPVQMCVGVLRGLFE
jgi:hypothetical protein